MEQLTFSNKAIKIKVKFYESMVKLEGHYVFDKMPKYIGKHPVKVRKLKNGKVSLYMEFFIPNGFIYDAMCIDDKETSAEIMKWLKGLVTDIARQRGVELPEEKQDQVSQ